MLPVQGFLPAGSLMDKNGFNFMLPVQGFLPAGSLMDRNVWAGRKRTPRIKQILQQNHQKTIPAFYHFLDTFPALLLVLSYTQLRNIGCNSNEKVTTILSNQGLDMYLFILYYMYIRTFFN
jgi:hypothetical protein